VSSAPVFLAAASQRTRRIELGTAVIPIGYESPFRLAEDLAMADVLSRGRLQVGFSAGIPSNSELLAGLVFDGDWIVRQERSHRTESPSAHFYPVGTSHRLPPNLTGDFLRSCRQPSPEDKVNYWHTEFGQEAVESMA
jgi:alkanesulfonate monooxygenase SsuD/methylene tetrahydromethanopterin reductase-like flavin-dependent oxidoreductase (luciferase family)